MRDTPSFEAFVEENVDDLVRMAYLITWDESEAEELVQECLFRLARRWPRVSSMEMPLAYARRILINLGLDGRKRRDDRRSELNATSDHLSDARAEAALDAIGVREELVAALGQLPPQQRTVLGLRYFLDLSEAQVAAILGCSPGAVKSAASRGLARVREMVVSPSPESEGSKS
jgi:RNA polymerase sigma-70 factor (sigma-E family)